MSTNFSIQDINDKGLELIRLEHHNGQTQVDILPGHGATLHAFRVMTVNGPLNIIDNYPSADAVQKEMARSFKGPKLSPFVCRIPEGQYRWDNTNYEFGTKFSDGSAIHGLLYNKVFTVIEKVTDEQKASVQLEYRYNNDDKGYPFEYSCKVIYTLYPGNVLDILTIVTNLSKEPIPIADGWHPYFSLNARINDCEMEFSSATMLEFDEKLIPTGNFVNEPTFTKMALIGDRFLDNCFLLEQRPGKPACSLLNRAGKLRLDFYPDSNYPYLQIYTPDHRNSIAIENLSGAPNCFNNGMGLKKILPGESESFNVRYVLAN